MKYVGMSAAAAKRAPKGAKPETTRSPAQLKGLEKARAARKAKRETGQQEIVEAPRPETTVNASAVESLIEQYAERWNKVGSQADADRLQAEIEHAAKTLASEQLLAYAAAPKYRGQILVVCVSVRAQERAAMPRRSAERGADPTGAPKRLSSTRLGCS